MAAILGTYTPRDAGSARKAVASLEIAALVHPEDLTLHYNLGCVRALAGDDDAALDALEQAALLGYDDAGWMAADADLASLRENPRFLALLARLREQGPDGR